MAESFRTCKQMRMRALKDSEISIQMYKTDRFQTETAINKTISKIHGSLGILINTTPTLAIF